jgi:hypothetical protein
MTFIYFHTELSRSVKLFHTKSEQSEQFSELREHQINESTKSEPREQTRKPNFQIDTFSNCQITSKKPN